MDDEGREAAHVVSQVFWELCNQREVRDICGLPTTMQTICSSLFLVLSLGLSAGAAKAAEKTPKAASKLGFNRDIRPILTENCYQCHGPDSNHRKADLRLDEREAAIEFGAIVPGKAEASSIIERIVTEDEDDLMPPPDSHKKLTQAEKDILRRWVAEGAEYEGHWAFLAPTTPAVPQAETPKGLHPNAIDAFVQQKLREHGFSLQPNADPRTLVRRVTLDLTGLPPSSAEVEAFVSAHQGGAGEAAYEALVDRLLASSVYGEHMTRMWLDYARYGDSHGYEKDSARTMWPWRDWVIKAFNDNKPFDQFTVEQLAGDLIPNAKQDQVIATGFNRNHRINAEGGAIAEEWRIENVIDRVDTTASTWLGLTMGCARCHDHKFDPITQKEFFQMFAFFSSVDEVGIVSGPSGNQKPLLNLADEKQKNRLAELDRDLASLLERKKTGVHQQQDAVRPDTVGSDDMNGNNPTVVVKGLDAEIKQARKARDAYANSMPSVMVMNESANPKPAHILIRGQYSSPGEVVTPAVPAFLPSLPAGERPNRLTFAKWLVDARHPLTSRVWVNRQWERFFGRGLVMSSDNLGVQCDPPSHPELLDWLATEFIRSGWDMKAMQKVIVMSATYRQPSKVSTLPPRLLSEDPQNRLLARTPRIRLSGETIRDQALQLSGLLDLKVGGPSVRPYMPEGVWDETSVYGDLRNYKPDLKNGLYRRTFYTLWKRTAAPPTLLLFDAPSREVCTVKRSSTNTPLQALALLNEVTFVEAARVLAQRMMKEGGENPAQRIAWAFQQVTQRQPRPDELEVLQMGWNQDVTSYRQAPAEAKKLIRIGQAPVPEDLDPAEFAAFTVIANVLLNLDEVITRE